MRYSKSARILLALILLALAGSILRIAPWIAKGSYIDTDPYFHHRWTEYILEHWALPERDFRNIQNPPINFYPHLMYWLCAAIGRMIPLQLFFPYIPFLVYLASLVAVYLVLLDLRDRRIALLSIAFLTLSFGNVERTMVGRPEEENLGLLLALIAILLLSRSYEKRVKRDSVISGILMLLSALTWKGHIFFYLIFGFSLALLILSSSRIGDLERIGILLYSLPPLALTPIFVRWRFSHICLLFLALLVFSAYLLGFLLAMRSESRFDFRQIVIHAPILLLAIAIPLLAILSKGRILPEESLRSYFYSPSRVLDVLLGRKLARLVVETSSASFARVVMDFGPLLLLFLPLGILYIARDVLRDPSIISRRCLEPILGIWSLLALMLYLSAIKFNIYLSYPISILSGISAARLERDIEKRSRKLGERLARLSKILPNFILLVSLAILLESSIYGSIVVYAKSYSWISDRNLIDALRSMNLTDEDVVFARWDIGHLLTFYTKCRVVHDNYWWNETTNDDFWDMLASERENRSLEILEKYGANAILLDAKTLWLAGRMLGIEVLELRESSPAEVNGIACMKLIYESGNKREKLVLLVNESERFLDGTIIVRDSIEKPELIYYQISEHKPEVLSREHPEGIYVAYSQRGSRFAYLFKTERARRSMLFKLYVENGRSLERIVLWRCRDDVKIFRPRGDRESNVAHAEPE